MKYNRCISEREAASNGEKKEIQMRFGSFTNEMQNAFWFVYC